MCNSKRVEIFSRVAGVDKIFPESEIVILEKPSRNKNYKKCPLKKIAYKNRKIYVRLAHILTHI